MAVAVVKNEFADNDRQTQTAVVPHKKAEWEHAIKLCAYLEDKGIISNAEFEDPTVPLTWHGCMFVIKGNVDFEESELRALSSMLDEFDGLTMVVEDDNITCSAVKHIYSSH